MENEQENKSTIRILSELMIQKVPSYANNIFFSLGFLSMTSFVILLLTGVIMVSFGPDWWLTNTWGIYIRSIHMWATQAFVFFIILHFFVVLFTLGYRASRRLIWVLGILMTFFVLLEAEFGYILRGDFSSQWRSLQASDLYNGSGLGIFINNLNYAQIYGVHIAIIPFIIIGLLGLHYLLVRVKGISTPSSEKVTYHIVKANHKVLFLRGMMLVAIILILALFFRSPFLPPTTIKAVASEDPSLVASTILDEYDSSSDTATYMDSIDPYQYDTQKIYFTNPYSQYIQLTHSQDVMVKFNSQSKDIQDQYLKDAKDYFDKKGNITTVPNYQNPVVTAVSYLVEMAQTGLYESSLQSEQSIGNNLTYTTRFLADTGVMDDKAQSLGITTDQYGMIHEETSSMPFGAWWLSPIGILDHTILATDNNQDRDGAIIIGTLFLFLIAFPYIPYLNTLPEKIEVYKLIQR